MKKNRLKERLINGEMILGSWNIIPSPEIVEIAGHAGLDFIIIDSEHGPVGLEAATNSIRAAEAIGITPLARVPTNEPYLILRALDIGAYGVQVPHISTKADTVAVLENVKYYPLGKRGLSPFTRAAGYGKDEKTHVADSNENTMVILNIEGAEGIKNLNDIIEVPGIDVIFFGPYDISQSLGKPGKIDDPEVVDLIKKSVVTLRKKGLACGSFAHDARYMELLIDCGVQYLTYMVDSAMILEGYRSMRGVFTRLTEKKGKK